MKTATLSECEVSTGIDRTALADRFRNSDSVGELQIWSNESEPLPALVVINPDPDESDGSDHEMDEEGTTVGSEDDETNQGQPPAPSATAIADLTEAILDKVRGQFYDPPRARVHDLVASQIRPGAKTVDLAALFSSLSAGIVQAETVRQPEQSGNLSQVDVAAFRRALVLGTGEHDLLQKDAAHSILRALEESGSTASL
jgi:hypothetical protein